MKSENKENTPALSKKEKLPLSCSSKENATTRKSTEKTASRSRKDLGPSTSSDKENSPMIKEQSLKRKALAPTTMENIKINSTAGKVPGAKNENNYDSPDKNMNGLEKNVVPRKVCGKGSSRTVKEKDPDQSTVEAGAGANVSGRINEVIAANWRTPKSGVDKRSGTDVDPSRNQVRFSDNVHKGNLSNIRPQRDGTKENILPSKSSSVKELLSSQVSKIHERAEYLKNIRDGRFLVGNKDRVPLQTISNVNRGQRFQQVGFEPDDKLNLANTYKCIQPERVSDTHCVREQQVGFNQIYSPQFPSFRMAGLRNALPASLQPAIDENNVSYFGSLYPSFESMVGYPNVEVGYPSVQALYTCPPPPLCMNPVQLQQYQYQEPEDQGGVPAFVDMDGYISIRLNHHVVVDISANKAVRLRDGTNHSTLTISSCGLQMALVHPRGRVLQYGSRIEVQCEDDISIKNAKMYPKGISFTANNCALVYLVDVAGIRTTSDSFHDLYQNNIADTLFREACKQNPEEAVEICSKDLNRAQYWRNHKNEDCWVFGEVFVQQKPDGLTVVERRNDREFILLKTSPSTGKVRLGNKFAAVTASLGEQSHVFIKAQERRMHYNGENLIFTVRNAGHAAGFDEKGELRLF